MNNIDSEGTVYEDDQELSEECFEEKMANYMTGYREGKRIEHLSRESKDEEGNNDLIQINGNLINISTNLKQLNKTLENVADYLYLLSGKF
tara:strand:+ start:500 stop:772 length:273 start_codon:yes stop_codon:yes gene_type:complete